MLSEELVADPNVAVLEFVKNAYDAEASHCRVHFELARRPVDGRLIISDDGSGMDLDGLRRNFMRPGFSEKADVDIEEGSDQRVPVGEKGLGRLAAGRLGEQLDLYTRRRPEDPWLHLGFRWSDFDDMNTPLDEVPVYVNEDDEPPEAVAETGTTLVISRLRMRWDARVPGRRVPGRATTRLGRLRQDLELLLLPLQAADLGFSVALNHNSLLPEDKDSSGAVDPPTLRLLDYQFDFAFGRDADRWAVLRTVRRSADLAERLGVPPVTEEEIDIDELFGDADPAPTLEGVGSFDASVYYTPESANALTQIRAPIGIRLYRDSVRVDPYGEPGNDWLGVAAHKASRQGHAGIDPKALYGAIRISRRANPELRPLANREGLLENEALQAFLTICRAQMRWFEKLVREEYREPKTRENRSERETKERAAEALTVQRYAVGITRSTVHALRQPVTAAGAELYRLRHTIENTEMPEELRVRLQELHDRTAAHLKRMDEAADRMMKFLHFDPTPQEIDIAEVVANAITQAAPVARSQQVELHDGTDGEPMVVELPAGLVERSLEELLANAIRAARPEGRAGRVTVETAKDEASVRISVWDNGCGVPDHVASRLFKETISTGGHIGVGLMFNRQLLALARGDLKLVERGPEGSRFDIILPT